jgi:hypothetical protein
MNGEQVFIVAFIGYVIVGAGVLIHTRSHPRFPVKSVWFPYLFLWPFLLAVRVDIRLKWWRIIRTPAECEEKLMRILYIRRLEFEKRGEGTDFMYDITFLNGVHQTYLITEEQFIYERRHPHYLLARKILTQVRSRCL